MITFSPDANMLAASCQNGTMLRMTDLSTGLLKSEVCRGSKAAEVSSISLVPVQIEETMEY